VERKQLNTEKRKTYVLRDEKLRTKVIWLHYNMLVKEYEE